MMLNTADVQNAPALAEEEEDKEAAKRREANRKKRERKAKAKKQAEAEGAAGANSLAAGAEVAPSSEPAETECGRWRKGRLPGNHAERRESGTERGLGVFTLDPIAKGETIAEAVPALSVIFDPFADLVCSYCLEMPKKGATTEHDVTLVRPEEAGFGLQLDDLKPLGADKPVTVVTRVMAESANREAVRIGDTFVSVEGKPVDGGHAVAVPLLQEAVKASGKASCIISRPALLTCPGCKRFACCAKCVGLGRMKWHAFECSVFQTIKGVEAAGESATLRMLLRYKMSMEPKVGEWSEEKEPVDLVTSLQGNFCDVPLPLSTTECHLLPLIATSL